MRLFYFNKAFFCLILNVLKNLEKTYNTFIFYQNLLKKNIFIKNKMIKHANKLWKIETKRIKITNQKQVNLRRTLAT